MARVATTFYQADTVPTDSTVFEWATLDDDPFDREKDMKNMALALERHDHSSGRGKPAARITTNTVDTASIQNNAVTTAKIADAQVTNAKLAANAVGTTNIIDANVTAAKLATNAVTTHLGFTPINKAGDTGIGTLAFTGHVQMGAGAQVQLNATASIAGSGYIALTPTSTAFTATISNASSTMISLQNTGASPGYSIGILNAAGSNWEMLADHVNWSMLGLALYAKTLTLSPTGGEAPIAVSTTTLCTNLNAALLQGLGPADFAAAANKVPAGLHAAFATAASIASGWTRATNCDGRIIVGAGTSLGVGGHPFTENAHAGSSWAAAGGAHTHTVEAHSHFLGNVPSKSASGIAAGSEIIALARAGTFDTYPTGPWSTGSTGASADWNFPTYAMVWAYKT